MHSKGSLPHRQLRKSMSERIGTRWRSLPHRQLRNPNALESKTDEGSLPHRQLRNIKIGMYNNPKPFTAAQAA